MSQRTLMLGLMLLIGASAAAPAVGQMRGRRGFGPGGRPTGLTPEQRERMVERMAQRQLEQFTEDYALTDEQREMAGKRLEELKVAQRKYAEPLAKEFQSLRREIADAYRMRGPDYQVDREHLTKARDRLRQMREDSPLMNRERVAESLEAILPEQQVKAGRQQREARQAERQAELQRQIEMWQQRGDGGRGDGDGERQGWRQRRSRPGSQPAVDPWDRYVTQFTRRYELDSAQQATAQSILQELKQQRDAYRSLHVDDYEAVSEIEGRDTRSAAYEKLNKPVAQWFETLKKRLDRIPTSAQRKAAQRAAPTSQPSRETSTSGL